MNCSGGKGWYYLGNRWDEERLGYEAQQPRLREYTQEVQTEGAEWAYGTCSGVPRVKPEGAVYRLRPRPEVRQRVETDMRKLQKAAEYQHGETQTRPLTVLMVVMDSLSRKHFYRKLNHTVDFLNQLDPDQTRVFDFKVHNVMGDNSLPNLYPVWSGRPIQPLSESAKTFNQKQHTDLLGEVSIWQYLEKQGFATMFLAEFCDNYFAAGIGRRPNVDHLAQRFWCAAESLSGYNDRGPFQRCIGNRNSHFYSLNYTLDFVHAYQGVNKWAHVMSLAGHEDSGTVAETLDDDLVEFLGRVLNTKDELVVFLMADHGMRYGEWLKVLDGSHEHKLPSLFLIASTSLLKDVPFSMATLQHNTERLVSKFDLHKTLAFLGELPYYRGWAERNSTFSQWKMKSGGISLFTTKIPNHRNCDSALIPSYFCSCLKFKEIDPEVYLSPQGQTDQSAHSIITYFAEEIIRQINDEVYTSARTWPGALCQKLRLARVEQVEWQFLSTSRHYYKLVLSVQESKAVRFEAVIMLSASFLPPHSSQTGYRVLPIYTEGRRQFRVMYIKRQDAYAGICEDMSKEMGVPAPLCICKPITDISHSFPALFLSLQSRYHLTLASSGLSCDLHCETQGFICASQALELLNICKEMKKLAGCGECFEAENQRAYPGARQGVCFVTRQRDFACSTAAAGVRRACACTG